MISNDLKITDVSGQQSATQTNQSPAKKEKNTTPPNLTIYSTSKGGMIWQGFDSSLFPRPWSLFLRACTSRSSITSIRVLVTFLGLVTTNLSRRALTALPLIPVIWGHSNFRPFGNDSRPNDYGNFQMTGVIWSLGHFA
ncbi:hypothetical protein C2G38_706085 [Gigaspora rosea]|uniref:Uncharacterized protein n=1 Tax=Gigaspora rosea TaxID=44941 RepID=A0A397VP09_9GLOM|nr:hypothetical protein C2G38_706085 [Gigaspora rosea]